MVFENYAKTTGRTGRVPVMVVVIVMAVDAAASVPDCGKRRIVAGAAACDMAAKETRCARHCQQLHREPSRIARQPACANPAVLPMATGRRCGGFREKPDVRTAWPRQHRISTW